MKELTALFNNFCHQGGTNIYLWPRYLIGLKLSLRYDAISSQNITQSNHSNSQLANVRRLDRHDSFRDFPIQFVSAMWSIRPYIGLKIKAVIPKSLWSARLNELPTRTFVQFLYFSFGCIRLGVNGSICFKWHDAFMSFLLNSPRTISLALSHIIAGGTRSH